MKFGQLIQHNMRNTFFFKNQAENEAGILVLDLLLFFWKALYIVEATSKTWTQTLDLDPENPALGKTWTLENLDSENSEL